MKKKFFLIIKKRFDFTKFINFSINPKKSLKNLLKYPKKKLIIKKLKNVIFLYFIDRNLLKFFVFFIKFFFPGFQQT
jgi:hypothetical protein